MPTLGAGIWFGLRFRLAIGCTDALRRDRCRISGIDERGLQHDAVRHSSLAGDSLEQPAFR